MQKPLEESSLAEFLQNLALVPAGERLDVELAGEGNINWVRRARWAEGGRSWVVKQARPALERFPEYRVSTHRIVIESRYYETVASLDTEDVCPHVFLFDDGQRVLVLEDLGKAERLDLALARGADVTDAMRALGRFLGAAHSATRDGSLGERFANDEMRRLHGDHIFHLPYRENDFPLSPAVRSEAERIRVDSDLVARIDAAYERYLEPRGALVHGDVQPGNVLLAPGGPKLLDAEIAHIGDPAFDVGVLLAHLFLYAVSRGDRDSAGPPSVALWSAYADAHGDDGLPAFRDAARYAGIEMLRRTIGAARVAAVEEDAAALAVIAAGRALVVEPPDRPGA